MKYFPVVNSFDNFIDYSENMGIEDYSMYLVEKVDDSIDYPFKRFDLCYGMNIKDYLHQLN